jgi:uncharacterized phage-associated protein
LAGTRSRRSGKEEPIIDQPFIFCEKCSRNVTYTVTETFLTGTVKGEKFLYVGEEAHCAECGSPVVVPGLSDHNLKALYDVYRQNNHIISLEKILEIPEKYAIGKRPLSLLLGWGEQTVSRYCDGDMPTRQYSDILTRIYNDPAYYAELLESGKGNLRSTAPYEKSKKAVEELLARPDTGNTRLSVAAEYLLHRCGDLTPLALQKALYYTQGFYYAFYQDFLFPENCEAWPHGPVFRDSYLQYQNYHFDPLSAAPAFDERQLTAAEKAVLDNVINHICCFSGPVLERLTCSETPWVTARATLPLTAADQPLIPQEAIGAYFTAVRERFHMLTPRDIGSYMRPSYPSL